MSVFAEALDNIVKKEINHTGVNYIHTQKGSLVMNYRLIPPLGPCLLNLIALLKSTMDISHCIDCLSKQVKEDKRAFTMKKKACSEKDLLDIKRMNALTLLVHIVLILIS